MGGIGAGFPALPPVTHTPSVVSIAVGGSPEGVTLGGGNGYAYVPNTGSNNVSVLNGTMVVASVSVGGGPYYAAYDDRNGFVYVPNSITNNVTVINGTKVVGSVAAGSQPYCATFDERNGYVYIANFASSNVTVINGTTRIGTIAVGADPWCGTYDPRNGFVYVANYGSASLSVINGTKVVTSLNVGNSPAWTGYDSRNGYVYVPNSGGNTVTVVNGTSSLGFVVVGVSPWSATFDAVTGYMYVPNSVSDNVSVINGTSIVGSVNVGSLPNRASGRAGDDYLYVVNSGSSDVTRIAGTRAFGSVNVGSNPASAIYDARNGYVYVANSGSSNVSAIQTWSRVTFAETGLPTGAPWSVQLTGGPTFGTSTPSLSFTRADGTYGYAVTAPNGSFSAAGGSFTVNRTTVAINVTFVELSRLNFKAAGLPPGTSWFVNLSGDRRTSTSASIVFDVPNGTYPWTAGSPSGFAGSPNSGLASVSGADQTFSLTFTRFGYEVAFREIGLPPGTSWGVELGQGGHISTSDTILFSQPNGSYNYSVVTPAGWTSSNATGEIVVHGAAVSVEIGWVVMTYGATFFEVGLPPGTVWWVNITGGPSMSSASSSLVFALANGTYPYLVAADDKTYSSPRGNLVVDGRPASGQLTFSRVTFPVEFVESALPPGTRWWVNTTGGGSAFSDSTVVLLPQPNGSRLFSVAPSDKTYSSPGGSVTVAGVESIEQVAFFRVLFNITFAETGLLPNSAWSMTFDGVTKSSSGPIGFAVPNGTFPFSVRTQGGYLVNPKDGTVPVQGHPISLSITFSPSPPTFLGLPSAEGYIVLGGIAVAATLGSAILVFRRTAKNRSRTGPTRPRNPV